MVEDDVARDADLTVDSEELSDVHDGRRKQTRLPDPTQRYGKPVRKRLVHSLSTALDETNYMSQDKPKKNKIISTFTNEDYRSGTRKYIYMIYNPWSCYKYNYNSHKFKCCIEKLAVQVSGRHIIIDLLFSSQKYQFAGKKKQSNIIKVPTGATRHSKDVKTPRQAWDFFITTEMREKIKRCVIALIQNCILHDRVVFFIQFDTVY